MDRPTRIQPASVSDGLEAVDEDLGLGAVPVASSGERIPQDVQLDRHFQRSESLYSNWNQRAHSSSEMIRGKSSTRFLLGPAPDNQLGPSARVMLPDADSMDGIDMFQLTCPDPSLIQMQWNVTPKSVLVIKKIYEPAVTKCFKELTNWIIKERKLTVFVEPAVLEEDDVRNDDSFASVLANLEPWNRDVDDKKEIDFVVCLGGDGTLLHAAACFQGSCPPMVAFHLGTLGFLTPFTFNGFHRVIDRIVENDNIHLTLRSRIKCQVLGRLANKPSQSDDGSSPMAVLNQYLLLNELVIDRGSGSGLAHLDIICNGRYLTTLLGDGLIVSTPTGSTAYSAAAGASMVHPDVPGIILTAICPHSLSFRPIVLPPGVELKIQVASVPHRAPQSAWASFDGRDRQEITPLHCVRVTTSVHPVPCINRRDHLNDWFDGLSRCLRWNAREQHKKSDTHHTTSSFPS